MDIDNNDKNEESYCRNLSLSKEEGRIRSNEGFFRGCLREDPKFLGQKIKRPPPPKCRRKFDWFPQEKTIPAPESPTFPILSLDIPLVSVF